METDPIFGSDFFGREDFLDTLHKRVQAFLNGYRQNIGLIGKKSIGKTSLLCHFLPGLNEPELIPIYVKVMPETLSYFARKLMGSLLTSYLKVRGEPIPREFNTLVNRTKRLLPRTLRKMREINQWLTTEEWHPAFREILSLTQLLREESGKKILLVLDDFDHLEALLPKNPFHEFGNAIMMQKDTLFLVSSSKVRKARVIFHEKLALLFGNFEVLELKPFDFPTCGAYLAKRFPGIVLDEEIQKFLVELTDGYPYFLEILTERCRNYIESEKSALRTEIWVQALEYELYLRKGCLHQYFLRLLQGLGREKAFHASLKVLLAIALGYKKAPSITHYLRRKSGEIKKILMWLLDEELIEKKGSFFTVGIPLFGFWLRAVYYPREFDLGERDCLSMDTFRRQVLSSMRLRREEEAKELPKRVEELFRQFRNDVVEVGFRKVKCPHFAEVVSKPSNGRVFPVEAKAAGSRWICQVAHKKVTEEDVRSFIQDIQKLKRKVNRKIMITLRGIELNAKLMAKEAQILLWSLKDFNALLDLYNRSKIILEEIEWSEEAAVRS